MALLDKLSLHPDSHIITIWANGKEGSINPTKKSTYIFVEHERINGIPEAIYKKDERDEKCPVLAFGFVFYWLFYRKRRAQSLDSVFCGNHEGKTPKEIFDLYIEARKAWFMDMMKERPDAWRYPDPEKLFYEQNLTVESEEELIAKSQPLLEYLDEEDKEEFIEVMANFLEYVASIIKKYHDPAKDQMEAHKDNTELSNSSEWERLIERIVKPFDDVMTPVGFYELPEIKKLTRPGQCELILKLLTSPIPFKIALLNNIGMIEKLDTLDFDTEKEKRATIAKALGIKSDNRELRGNINALNPKSKEDMSKYTVHACKSEASSFLHSLPCRPC